MPNLPSGARFLLAGKKCIDKQLHVSNYVTAK